MNKFIPFMLTLFFINGTFTTIFNPASASRIERVMDDIASLDL